MIVTLNSQPVDPALAQRIDIPDVWRSVPPAVIVWGDIAYARKAITANMVYDAVSTYVVPDSYGGKTIAEMLHPHYPTEY